jgi:excisionase family DNA binding protein
MSRSHKGSINSSRLWPVPGPFRPSRTPSGCLAHLGVMEISRSALRHSEAETVVQGTFEPTLSLRELAAQLHVSVQTLYDLRSQGRGPTGFRVGRHLRFRCSEIEAWLGRLEEEDLSRHPGVNR